jgi:N-dimethylarginine dimethylaminohydrolase
MSGTVLVRRPSSRLAEDTVTHLRRTPVDAQHKGYAEALAANGWTVHQVPAADDCRTRPSSRTPSWSATTWRC